MQQFTRKRLVRFAIVPVVLTALVSLYSFAPSANRSIINLFKVKNIESVTAGISGAATVVEANLSFYDSKKSVFDSLDLEAMGLSRKVFNMALKGMEKLKKTSRIQSNILSIVDFTKPSTSKRLFIVDLDNVELLFNTLVAHGNKSGKEWAQSFSNKISSNKSSIGFYVTGNPYKGSNGYSLKLDGVEKGFNNNAYKRAIVLHGADYVNEEYISSQGYIGRSQGCPAVMPEVTTPIIETIKGGTCLFIYYPLPTYLKRSTLLH